MTTNQQEISSVQAQLENMLRLCSQEQQQTRLMTPAIIKPVEGRQRLDKNQLIAIFNEKNTQNTSQPKHDTGIDSNDKQRLIGAKLRKSLLLMSPEESQPYFNLRPKLPESLKMEDRKNLLDQETSLDMRNCQYDQVKSGANAGFRGAQHKYAPSARGYDEFETVANHSNRYE